MKKILLQLPFLALSLQLFAQIPTTGLVGYWPFTGNATDQSGNGNNGVVTGATLTTDRNGISGSAYAFNGTSAFITIPDQVALRLGNTDFTIGVWVNQFNLLSTQEAILSKRTMAPQSGYLLNIEGPAQPDPGVVNYQVSGGADPRANSNATISLGSWYHLVVRYTLITETVELFINGIPDNVTTGIPAPNPAITADMIIGNDAGGNPYFFHGKIDDIAIYDRALTVAEIYELYNPCTGVNINSNIVAKYTFTGNANDASGNGYNGSVTGATLTTDRFGNTGGAYLFNGTTDFITIPDNASLRLSNTDFTISAWINESNTLSSQEAVISKRGTGSQNGYLLNMTGQVAPTPGLVNFHVSGGVDPKAVSIDTVPFNSWHHIGVVYDLSEQTIFTYIDGVLNRVTAGIPSPNAATTVAMTIGNDASGSPYFFHGKIDDIHIYNRALTSCDMDSLFSMPDPGTTGLFSPSMDNRFEIYPNPASDVFTVKGLQEGELRICDLSGRWIRSVKIQQITTEINIEQLADGIYFIQITDAPGNMSVKKLVKKN